MAKKKPINPRIYVPVSEDARAAMQMLADVRKSSLAAICGEMLEICAPIAVDMANALKMAQEAPAKALRMMNESLDVQLASVDQYRLELSPKATGSKKKRKTG